MLKHTVITFRNDFHNSTAKVIATDGIISARSIRNAKKELCGVKNCTCGGIRGNSGEVCAFGETRYKIPLLPLANGCWQMERQL